MDSDNDEAIAHNIGTNIPSHETPEPTVVEDDLSTAKFLVEQQYDDEDADFIIFGSTENDIFAAPAHRGSGSQGPGPQPVKVQTAFKVHRSKLAAASQVFADMFDVCSPENTSSSALGRVRLVEHVDTIKVILGHIHGDDTHIVPLYNLSWSILSDVMSAAHKYEVGTLLSQVTDVLILKPIRIPEDSGAAMSVLLKTKALFMTESLHDTILDKLSLSPTSKTFQKSSVEDDCHGYMKVATKRDEVLRSAVTNMVSALSNHIDLVQRSALLSAPESLCDAFALENILSISTLQQKNQNSWASRHAGDYQAIRAIPWCADSIAIRSVMARQFGMGPLRALRAENGVLCVEWHSHLCHFKCMEAVLWPELGNMHAPSANDWE